MKKNTKGSVLAYSLLILAMMFAIIGSISAVSVLEKKSAGSSQSSSQAFQVADNGLQFALKKINKAIETSSGDTIASVFGSCSPGPATVTGKVDSDKPFTLTFYGAGDSLISDCNTLATNVESIKSVGDFKNTTRAVKLAVAASGSLTGIVQVKKFSSGKKAQCLTDGIPTGCSAEGEKGCTTAGTANSTLPVNSDTIFNCVGFGDRGSNCYLFCVK